MVMDATSKCELVFRVTCFVLRAAHRMIVRRKSDDWFLICPFAFLSNNIIFIVVVKGVSRKSNRRTDNCRQLLDYYWFAEVVVTSIGSVGSNCIEMNFQQKQEYVVEVFTPDCETNAIREVATTFELSHKTNTHIGERLLILPVL